MQRINLRVVLTGAALILLAAAFFLYMLTLTGKSTDPATMMRTVGTVSGVAVGLGLAMIVFGLFK